MDTNMKKSRRDFLRHSGCAAASAAAFAAGLHKFGMVAAYAQTTAPDYRALVCVFLSGGNDAWNTVVCQDEYSSYATVRGALALPQSSLLPIRPRSDSRLFGLHPNLPELRALWDQQRLAVVCNMGTLTRPITRAEYLSRPDLRPPNLFSHSDQVAQWQAGAAASMLPTGWGGRMGDHTRGLNGSATFPLIVSTAGSNLYGVGQNIAPYQITSSGSVSLRGFNNTVESNIRYGALQQLLAIDRDHPFVSAAGDTLTKAINNDAQLVQALNTAPPLTTVFPNTGLGTQLRTIARLISARNILNMRRQVFFCQIGGFDTHGGQLGAQATLFTELSQALNAFHSATVEMGVGDSVAAFTNSDFGRTYRFNGGGTDHGWGSVQFVLGGPVLGGDFYGRWPTLAVGGPDDTGGDMGRFIPTTSVEQYGASLARWFGLPPGDIPLVFPAIDRFAVRDLGFLV
jgi:uncharacterized protein (DUF1501 family)